MSEDRRFAFEFPQLKREQILAIVLSMSAIEATAEVFFTAFKSLKPRQREAVLVRMLADDDISADIADTLALESRRHQHRQPFRLALKELGIKV